MNLLVISSNYPSPVQPQSGAFVYNLMQEMAKNHTITVIAPKKIISLQKKKPVSYGPEACRVLRPSFLSASNKNILGLNTRKLTEHNFKKAVLKAVKMLNERPDIVYCHFLRNALPILDYIEQNDLPLIIASGESTYNDWKRRPNAIQAQLKRLVNHVVCVSRENKDQLEKFGFAPQKMTIIPNAVNYEKFKPLDKNKCRQGLGIELNKFVVGFIGHFIHRKGPNRIIQAIKTLKDDNIHLICAGGQGGLEPNNFTSELGKTPNYQLPEVYNAFDIFVLPTLHEGSCNVIEEAKACGIPIVSSKGTSVEEQIDQKTGILVDPLNIQEIATAINKLKTDNVFYETLQQNLLEKRGENSLQNRARRINEVFLEVTNKAD